MHSDENVLDDAVWAVWEWKRKQKQRALARRNRFVVGTAFCLIVLGIGICTSLMQ